MPRATQYRLYALIGALALAFTATAGWSQSITWLGTLGGTESEAIGVSADGSVVVGFVRFSGEARAFRWTQGGGMQLIPNTLGGRDSRAYGVSADGTVVVGWAADPNF